MPGLYLAALLLSFAGVLVIDLRFGIVARRAPWATAGAVAIGTAFFLVWDGVGIATGVFVKGSSPLLVGIDLAPHLPVEEPVFLAFLSYLGVVSWAATLRVRARRAEDAR
ncbi:lycopene cyclase domain-containing protein [Microbacterium sp. NPDC091313]